MARRPETGSWMWLAAASLVAAAGFLAAAGPATAEEDGRIVYNNHCRTCHSTKEGDDRLGPNLHAIVGREAGATEFGYSDALAKADFEWTREKLDAFIENPDAVVTGHGMKPYPGIADAKIRETILDFLEGL